jgi:hypothetical protein
VPKDLIPSIVPEPAPLLCTPVDTYDPRGAKSTGSLSDVDDSLLVFGRECILHNLVDFESREYAIESLVKAVACRDIDTFAPIARDQSFEGRLELLRWIVEFDERCDADRLYIHETRLGSISQRIQLTNRDDIGKTSGATTFSPSSFPVKSLSCAEKACFHCGVGAKGLPAASRAPPRKNGRISTSTPCATKSGRNFLTFVKPNHEYGDTLGNRQHVSCEWSDY